MRSRLACSSCSTSWCASRRGDRAASSSEAVSVEPRAAAAGVRAAGQDSRGLGCGARVRAVRPLEAKRLVTPEVAVRIPGLAPAFVGYRIALVTDLLVSH